MLELRDFVISKEIFRGQSGTFFEGENQAGEPVLIRVPSSRYLKEIAPVRLMHEYEVTADLATDSVLQTRKVVCEGTERAVIYEHFEGLLLAQILAPLHEDPHGTLAMVTKLVRALAEIHQREIIHKNLNPENIFYHPPSGQLKIGGFQWASALTKESPRILSVHGMEGLPQYISPEQTGRAGRSVDYRADYYAVGVILYQMLSGKLPFPYEDPLTLIHAHCVREPEPLYRVKPQLPRALTEVTAKLLAKAPEDRYQTAAGLQSDLLTCQELVEEDVSGREPFVPGRRDRPRHFQLPQKFFGRESERKVLEEALQRAGKGQFTFQLIGGDAGVGRADLLLEAQRRALQGGSYFAMDGFNPLTPTVPYLALQNIFRALILQLLDEGPERLEVWRKEIQRAVGKNARLLQPMVPDLEKLLGQQPQPLHLPREEEAKRLEKIFFLFLGAIARRAKPLVLLLTELHWADSASLRLLGHLIEQGDVPFLAVIGTFQSDKIGPNHPMERLLEKVRENAADFGYIHLNGFSRMDTTRFIAETLDCEERKVSPLAQVIFEKTGGNPFFVGQFLKALYQKNLLNFDEEKREWYWQREEIVQLEMTENMGELLAEKIDILPTPTKEALKVGAVVGEEFDLSMVASLVNIKLAETAATLWSAVQEGLIFPMGEAYRIFIPGREQVPTVSESLEGTESFRFAHEKIQAAAYAMWQEGEREEHHLKVGEILQSRIQNSGDTSRFMDMVNHLNRGSKWLREPERQEHLARINLEAAKRARASAAYQSALAYCRKGAELLPDRDQRDPLFFQLRVLWADCAYLNTNFDEAEQIIASIAATDQAPTGLDLARIYDLRVILCANRGRNQEGIESAYKALRLLGIRFPKGQDQVNAATKREMERFEDRWRGKTIADLAFLQEMKSPEKQIALKVLTNLVPLWNQTYQTEGRRIMLLAIRGINLSVEHGNSAYSAVCYSLYGMFSLEWHQNARLGLELGKLGMRLADKFGSGVATCRTNNIFGAFINHWSSHARTSLDYLEKGFRAGRDFGEPVYAVYALIHKLVIRAFTEAKLGTVNRATQEYRDYVSRTNYREFLDFLLSYQWMLNQFTGQEDAFFQYDAFLERLQDYQDKIPLCVHYLNEAKVAYFLEDYARAADMVKRTGEHIGFLSGSLLAAEHIFYEALSLVALYPRAPIEDQRTFLRKIEENHRKLDFWADQCPENFLHLKLMVEAEWMAIHERHLQAMQLFDEAIDAAHAQGFLNFASLANELAAKFYLGKGRKRIATVYLTDAFAGYRDWGATAKCRQLEARYREYIRLALTYQDRHPKEGHHPRTPFVVKDRQEGNLSLFRDAGMIHGEEDKAYESFLYDVLKTTQAQSGHLILNREGLWLVKAEGWHDERGISVLKGVPVDDCTGLSSSIVGRVAEEKKPLLLGNALKEGRFTKDPQIVDQRTKSLLCVPLVQEAKIRAMVCVQSSLVADAFTPPMAEQLKHYLERVEFTYRA